MLDDSEYRRWREEATAALRGAGLQGDGGLHNWACFLAEQAAQLAVKGLLHGVGRGGWGHDLVVLGDRVQEELGEALAEDLRSALQRLSRHYIPARYPDAHPAGGPGAHYGHADYEQAVADARLVLDHVDARWRALVRLADEASKGAGGVPSRPDEEGA